ncbi:MAG: 50S ribosomal protein L18 [Nanoarchaeota archaeon]
MKTIKRRRKENRTDYGKRFKMLKSERPRIVFRKTNKHIIAQYVTGKETQDKIEIGVSSKALLKHGWPEEFKGSLKSITASYLTGLLVGKKILKEKKQTPIVDLGMIRNIHKTKTFAFLKGLADSGLKIKHDAKTFPEKDRIEGKHLKKDFSKTFEKVKLNIEKI